jgi:GntR family transcriptional regulator
VVPMTEPRPRRPEGRASILAMYDYLVLPLHERAPYTVQTQEDKVVVHDPETSRGSLGVVPVDPADPRAVYQQLADRLRTRILSGDLAPGSVLPSETELIQEYGVSRGPARQAVAVLKAEGLVDVRQGRGVFVRRRPPRYRLSGDRFAHARRQAGELPFSIELAVGGTPKLEVRRYTAIVAPPEITKQLQLKEGERVLARSFRLFADDHPVQVSDSYLPYDLVAGTRVEDPASEPWPGGTIAQLGSLGVHVTEIAEDVATRAPRPEEAQDLLLGPGTPVFEVTRIMFAGERPVVASTIVIAGDRYLLSYRIPVG